MSNWYSVETLLKTEMNFVNPVAKCRETTWQATGLCVVFLSTKLEVFLNVYKQ